MNNRQHKARSQLPEKTVKGYPREHFNADRSPKMQYKSYQSARGVARHMYHKTGEILEPYLCSICGCWHLGHVPEMKESEELQRLKYVINAERDVLRQYHHDLNHFAAEVLALQTKIEKLEVSHREHYHELMDFIHNNPQLNNEDNVTDN